MQFLRLIAVQLFLCGVAFAQVFTAPITPPETHYTIDLKLDVSATELTGSGSAMVRNSGKHDVRAVAFEWSDDRSGPFELTLGGKTRQVAPAKNPIEITLPEPLRPGGELKLAFRFRRVIGDVDKGWSIQQWFPHLWWGYSTHASYDVGITAPMGVAVAASAHRDAKTGRYRADHIATFGLFFARGFEVAETAAGATQVRSIFRPNMRQCAELVLKTAADAVNFYRQHFGMYPQPSLTIIPGAPKPNGGYPYATAMVVIHGQEACSEKPDTHWRWIATHEVGHQYWLEHVLEKDPEQGYGWLMIGLGIWTDREYARTHGMEKLHPDMLKDYADAVRKGLNTTVEIAPEELRRLDYDYNTQVTHHKGFGIVSGLAAVIGRAAFGRTYQRCLREYAGRRLGSADFRRIAEEESGQDLGWFFVPLLRTNKFASYEIADTTKEETDRNIVRVRVNSTGNLLLPVPVEARFTNGERQRATLDRTRDEQTLEFSGGAPLAEAIIDPDHEFPLVIPPPEITTTRLAELVEELPWSGTGSKPLQLYRRAVELDAKDLQLWGKLGLTLFDSRRYQESLDAFNRTVVLVAGKNATWHFTALTWCGMLNDLLGHRDAAIESYKQALAISGNPTMQHSQFNLVLNRAWVEERLKTPFTSR